MHFFVLVFCATPRFFNGSRKITGFWKPLRTPSGFETPSGTTLWVLWDGFSKKNSTKTAFGENRKRSTDFFVDHSQRLPPKTKKRNPRGRNPPNIKNHKKHQTQKLLEAPNPHQKQQKTNTAPPVPTGLLIGLLSSSSKALSWFVKPSLGQAWGDRDRWRMGSWGPFCSEFSTVSEVSFKDGMWKRLRKCKNRLQTRLHPRKMDPPSALRPPTPRLRSRLLAYGIGLIEAFPAKAETREIWWVQFPALEDKTKEKTRLRMFLVPRSGRICQTLLQTRF